MPPRNAVLSALRPDERDRLLSHLVQDEVTVGRPVYRIGEAVERVYFPLDGVYSEFVVLLDGATVEVGTIGNEGMVGLPVFFGATTSVSLVEGQIPGTALSMTADAFRAEVGRFPGLRAAIERYVQAYLHQVAQTAACNAVHTTEQRVGRWLLMTSDRVQAEAFLLTHELLARMLGTRRETVTAAAGRLQRAGLVRYVRGHVSITDRPGLEAAACECYGRVAESYRRLLRVPAP